MFETAQILTNLSPVFLVHVSVILEYCLNVLASDIKLFGVTEL